MNEFQRPERAIPEIDPSTLTAVVPCQCVYPDKCFCTEEQRHARSVFGRLTRDKLTGQIIDGRHRAAAAEALGVDISDRCDDVEHYVAFVVEDATGEPQTIRPTFGDALKGIVDCEIYYYDAETCGAIGAADWVNKKRPFSIRPITESEREEIIDNGTPVLDREP